MMYWIQQLALVVSFLISLGTLLATLRNHAAQRIRKKDSISGELKLLRTLLQLHTKEEEARKKELVLRREVDCCVLRDLITEIYYRYAKEKKIPVYVMQDLSSLYSLYRKCGGNSYVQGLMREIREEWEVECG